MPNKRSGRKSDFSTSERLYAVWYINETMNSITPGGGVEQPDDLTRALLPAWARDCTPCDLAAMMNHSMPTTQAGREQARRLGGSNAGATASSKIQEFDPQPFDSSPSGSGPTRSTTQGRNQSTRDAPQLSLQAIQDALLPGDEDSKATALCLAHLAATLDTRKDLFPIIEQAAVIYISRAQAGASTSISALVDSRSTAELAQNGQRKLEIVQRALLTETDAETKAGLQKLVDILQESIQAHGSKEKIEDDLDSLATVIDTAMHAALDGGGGETGERVRLIAQLAAGHTAHEGLALLLVSAMIITCTSLPAVQDSVSSEVLEVFSQRQRMQLAEDVNTKRETIRSAMEVAADPEDRAALQLVLGMLEQAVEFTCQTSASLRSIGMPLTDV